MRACVSLSVCLCFVVVARFVAHTALFTVLLLSPFVKFTTNESKKKTIFINYTRAAHRHFVHSRLHCIEIRNEMNNRKSQFLVTHDDNGQLSMRWPQCTDWMKWKKNIKMKSNDSRTHTLSVWLSLGHGPHFVYYVRTNTTRIDCVTPRDCSLFCLARNCTNCYYFMKTTVSKTTKTTATVVVTGGSGGSCALCFGGGGRSHSNDSLVRHCLVIITLFISIYFFLLFLAFRSGELNGNFLILFRWFTGFVFALTTFDVVEYVSVSVWCAVQYTNFHSNRIESKHTISATTEHFDIIVSMLLLSESLLSFSLNSNPERIERESLSRPTRENWENSVCTVSVRWSSSSYIVFSLDFPTENRIFCRIFLSHIDSLCVHKLACGFSFSAHASSFCVVINALS